MRKVIAALAAVFGMLVVTAPPAIAAAHGTSCGSWQHGGNPPSACVFTDESSFFNDKDGTVEFSGNGNYWVRFDYVRLFRNGTQVKANNVDQYRSISGGFQVSTPRYFRECPSPNGTYYTIARYQFEHEDGHVSGWVVRQSGSWTDTSDCSQ